MISNFESVPSLFVGQGDMIIFDAIADYTSATLASLTNPKSLGQVVEDSSNWTGDDVSVDEIRDEQGNLIAATVTAGTLSFEADIASTSQLMMQTFLKGTSITTPNLSQIFGSGSGAGTVTATGFGVDLPVITRPIGWLNDELNRLLLFPKAKITGNLTNSDKLMRVHINCLAEYVDLTSLKTGMIFDSTAAAKYSA